MTSRSRLLSVAALTLCVVLSGPSLALAQETPEGSQEVHSQLDDPVYDTGTGKRYSVTSSTFSNTPVSNKFAADDVIVPPGSEWWRVTSVSIVAQLCLDQSLGDTISLLVYYNSGALDSGSPGFLRQKVMLSGWSSVCAADSSQVDLQLQTPIVLPSGNKYWLSVQSDSNTLILDRKLFWATRGAAVNQSAMYYGNGDCRSEWQARTTCVSDVLGNDMAWSLTYSTFNGNAVYMPQLGRP